MCATAHGTTCHALPAKNHVIAKPVRTLAVAIRLPRPLGPLPKGGWHGEAVTGGFLSRRTSCNAFVGAGFYPARGRGRAPPLRTTKKPTVPLAKNHVIAKPVRTLAVAIRNSKDPTRQKRPAPGRSFSNIPYITIYPLSGLILTPLEDLQNIVEMALLLFQLRLFLRGNALRRLLGGLLCLRGSLSGHRL